MFLALAMVVGPALPASAAAIGPAAITKVVAKKDKKPFTELRNSVTGKRIKVKGYTTCLKISAHKKWAGSYAVAIYQGSQVKTRKYVGTIIQDKGYDQDPCFASGKTRADAGKLKKLGFYGLEPKTTYTFEVHAFGGRSHKDTLKVLKVKTP
ncbi:hypothetical protein [Paeniglutamicibacter cryotolerans]|nr:hypothetical protein [Paeniglutamicibacter cryotolerans]